MSGKIGNPFYNPDEFQKMTNIIVSVAICTYNGEQYVEEQIESVLTQTIKPNEIIICDDCSTDKTPELLTDYKNKFPEPILTS